MKIAITSGKGGSGKTLLSTSLASTIAIDQSVNYIDCDVEAPNGYLFLKPDNIDQVVQTSPCITSIDMDNCIMCGKCARTCFNNAIIVGRGNAMVFPELCRYCGACEVVCQEQALVKGTRPVGTTFTGQSGNIKLSWAQLATGAGGMTTTLIDSLLANDIDGITILDSPPGTSCPVVHTVECADIVVLAADPTLFGMHDLKLSVSMCRSLGIDPLVIINRCGIGDLAVLKNWCEQERLTIVGELPDSREIAQCYSSGKIASENIDSVRELFKGIAQKIISHKPVKTEPVAIKDSIYLTQSQGRRSAVNEVNNKNAFEIAVLSGKGGSGKTSVSACLSQLSANSTADCDVDAADLHLLLDPDIEKCSEFIGGKVMQIDSGKCHPCGQCKGICKFDAIERIEARGYRINDSKCEGCGACLEICPRDAIYDKSSIDGRLYISNTRFGKLSHATLAPSLANSGKMVTTVRSQAASDGNIVIIDGSPGTGCPVIASVGGVKYAVLVTEPTVSGLHDLKQVYDLCRHFRVPAGVVINKADINFDITAEIESYASDNEIELLGRLSYDNEFNLAQQARQTILEFNPKSDNAGMITKIWETLEKKVRDANG